MHIKKIWISGKDLMKLLGLLPNDIAAFAESGLEIYTNDGVRMIERSVERYPILRNHMRTEINCGGRTQQFPPDYPPEGYVFPKCRSKMFNDKEFLKEIATAMFRVGELDLFFSKHNVNVSVSELVEQTAANCCNDAKKIIEYASQSCDNEQLSNKEHRELGILRKKIKDIPNIIQISVSVGLYIASLGRRVTKDDIRAVIRNSGFQPDSLTEKEIEQIWKALPEEQRVNGRPKNDQKGG